MKNIIFVGIIVSLLFCACKQETAKERSSTLQNKAVSEVELLADNQLRYIELSGSPYERGLTHGKLLKKEIREVIRLFKEDIQNVTNEDPDAFIAEFLKQTDYKSAIQKWTPDLLEEMKGIAEGSEIDMSTIFMHQLGDEYWFNTRDILAHSCSSFGVNKSTKQPSIAAQNMDIPPFYHGFQTVVKIMDPDSDKEMIFLTIPGHLGITGMNNRSVSINCNTLMQLDYGKTGLPVTCIVRGVVAKNTQEEALAFLHSIDHASGQNYIIGGPQKVFSMECSANKVAEFRPFENSEFTYHTNHPMTNSDYSPAFLTYLKEQGLTLEESLNQCQRIQSFEERFTAETENIDIEDIKNVLRSRDNESKDVVSNEHTYASVIYVLSDNPKFLIAPGKPHEHDYLEISF